MELGAGGRGGAFLQHRYLQQEGTAGPQHPVQLGQSPIGVGDVFEDVGAEDHVDGVAGQIDVLQIDANGAGMGPLVEIRAQIVEPLGHGPPVCAIEPGAGLQQPQTAFVGPLNAVLQAPEQKTISGDGATTRTNGGLGMVDTLEVGSAPATDVALAPASRGGVQAVPRIDPRPMPLWMRGVTRGGRSPAEGSDAAPPASGQPGGQGRQTRQDLAGGHGRANATVG